MLQCMKTHYVAVQSRGTIALPADLRRRLHLDEPGAQIHSRGEVEEAVNRLNVELVIDQLDELLDRVSSKYALVIYAAKRARQINDYYNQLGDGILEYVGPLVEPGLQEKPLSIALREIHADLLEHTEGE